MRPWRWHMLLCVWWPTQMRLATLATCIGRSAGPCFAMLSLFRWKQFEAVFLVLGLAASHVLENMDKIQVCSLIDATAADAWPACPRCGATHMHNCAAVLRVSTVSVPAEPVGRIVLWFRRE